MDEAGFLAEVHVDQLAELVDDWHVDVYCFGLATDFRSLLLSGAKRLFELADEINPVHVEVLCWCGRPGQLNARVVDGRVVREGDTVVVGKDASVRAVSSSDCGRGDQVTVRAYCPPIRRRLSKPSSISPSPPNRTLSMWRIRRHVRQRGIRAVCRRLSTF